MTVTALQPSNNFQASVEQLVRIAQPTDLIISGFLGASKTFAIYDAVYRELNIPGAYRPCEIPRLSDSSANTFQFSLVMDIVRINHNIRSLVISDPYKILAYENLKDWGIDHLSPSAQSCGAVNLITRESDRLVGSNIDGRAFKMGLQEAFPDFTPKSIAIIGCGGVGSAVAVELAPQLENIVLVDLTIQKGGELIKKVRTLNDKIYFRVYSRPANVDFIDCDLLYNSSGLGKTSDVPGSENLSPLNLGNDRLPSKPWIAVDANYTPSKTLFLSEAQERKASILNGEGHMLSFVTQHINQLTGKEFQLSQVREIVKRSGILG